MGRRISIIIFILSLFLTSSVYARCGALTVIAGGTAAGAAPPAACDTQASPTDMETYDYAYSQVCSASALKWYSTQFVAGETETYCNICAYLAVSTGTSPTYTATMHIYNNSSDKPSTSVAAFESKDMTGVLTSGWQWICWEGSAALTATNTYHVVLQCSTYDGTNIMKWGKDDTCASEIQNRSADGSSWTQTDTDECNMVKLYK